MPTTFPAANCVFDPPIGFSAGQIHRIPAFRGQSIGGSLDGMDVVVVAWLPDAADLERLNAGGPVFLCSCGGLPPHLLTTEFTAELPKPT